MTRVAVTGHRGLSPQVCAIVDNAIRATLAEQDPATLVGISCLADGADQIFAHAILDTGGALEVVVPAVGYRDGLPAEAQPAYDQLLARASTVTRLDHQESTSTAHMEASTRMLRDADMLIAVWDGQPARGYGCTADVVNHARGIGIPVSVIWPPGAER
jgi:hypothetical protein